MYTRKESETSVHYVDNNAFCAISSIDPNGTTQFIWNRLLSTTYCSPFTKIFKVSIMTWFLFSRHLDLGCCHRKEICMYTSLQTVILVDWRISYYNQKQNFIEGSLQNDD